MHYNYEKEREISPVLALKGRNEKLLQNVPPNSQNIYATLIKSLELRFCHKYLRGVYCTQVRARR